ncbi:hypothetical protein GBF38_003773 [Nibea albiflora]|uniref:Uncharacterized protein n=1 Tax=Nibea albiflora TaxID=240163 RepID=A0ACB7F0L1_NIBAL|nr:hypothetical protein GBF38_003773 [Nibea albiflora]
MDYSQSFSALNERLRPRITTSEQLFSSLTRLEDRQSGSLRSLSSSYRPTVLQKKPETKVSEPEDPEELGNDADQENVGSDDLEEPCADLCDFDSSLNLKDEGDEDSTSPSEEKDIPGELSSKKGTSDSSESTEERRDSLKGSYEDGTLPDLIRSGRPLGRRRTVGHVSETLKEVRREVELSRRRSIKLKAQVDKLQESREGLGWSQHRERVKVTLNIRTQCISARLRPCMIMIYSCSFLSQVTEEVLSVLRLLHPLTESGPLQASHGENQLDKAMEAELLRSKTELMLLNNQLLEAVQKRLELSLELEAWKEDVQLILQQQLKSQQQSEQAQKKTYRLGILRRNNRPPIQRPPTIPQATSTPHTTNSNQIFISRSAVSTSPIPSTPSTPTGTQRWKDKLRRGKISHQGDQDAARQDSEWGNGFQVVSLD